MPSAACIVLLYYRLLFINRTNWVKCLQNGRVYVCDSNAASFNLSILRRNTLNVRCWNITITSFPPKTTIYFFLLLHTTIFMCHKFILWGNYMTQIWCRLWLSADSLIWLWHQKFLGLIWSSSGGKAFKTKPASWSEADCPLYKPKHSVGGGVTCQSCDNAKLCCVCTDLLLLSSAFIFLSYINPRVSGNKFLLAILNFRDHLINPLIRLIWDLNWNLVTQTQSHSLNN